MAGRVAAAIQRYRDNLLPPMFSAVLAQANVHEYAFGTPGHLGGMAFLKTPVSKIFFDYFGENLFRSDLSIGMAAVGSLLDHSGPIGESEKYAARVFGAHRSYTVTNGTSGSNRIIFMASLTQNDIALCDRNCHKSVEHGLVMTGAIPVFLVPHRNRYGIIGPIYPEDLQPEAVRTRASANPLTAGANRFKPQHTIITNSTYDGLIYNVERVIEIGATSSIAFISTKRGTPMRASTRSTAVVTLCSATPPSTKMGRHCSRHIRPTNCSQRFRRPHLSTFATGGTRSSMLVSTSCS